MQAGAMLLMVQVTTYGPALPQAVDPSLPVRHSECEQQPASGEIVVCAHQDRAPDQRLTRAAATGSNASSPGDRFRLKIGGGVVDGGGPRGQNGQSVGVALRIPFKL